MYALCEGIFWAVHNEAQAPLLTNLPAVVQVEQQHKSRQGDGDDLENDCDGKGERAAGASQPGMQQRSDTIIDTADTQGRPYSGRSRENNETMDTDSWTLQQEPARSGLWPVGVAAC